MPTASDGADRGERDESLWSAWSQRIGIDCGARARGGDCLEYGECGNNPHAGWEAEENENEDDLVGHKPAGERKRKQNDK